MSCTEGPGTCPLEQSSWLWWAHLRGLVGKASEKLWVQLQPRWAGLPGEAAGESWGTGRVSSGSGGWEGLGPPSSSSLSPGTTAHSGSHSRALHTHAVGARAHTALKPGQGQHRRGMLVVVSFPLPHLLFVRVS